jgi:uncharacterized protein with GYD domain
MPTYISLLNWTDQGIRKVKETTERAEAFQAIAGKMKVKVRNIYWTMGDCDVVLIMEASDDETLSRLLLTQVGERQDQDFEGLFRFGDGSDPQGSGLGRTR